MPYDAENIITEEQQEGQDLREGIKKATTLAQMIIAALQWAKAEAVKAVEQEIAERDQRRCNWPRCPKCGRLETIWSVEVRQIIIEQSLESFQQRAQPSTVLCRSVL